MRKSSHLPAPRPPEFPQPKYLDDTCHNGGRGNLKIGLTLAQMNCQDCSWSISGHMFFHLLISGFCLSSPVRLRWITGNPLRPIENISASNARNLYWQISIPLLKNFNTPIEKFQYPYWKISIPLLKNFNTPIEKFQYPYWKISMHLLDWKISIPTYCIWNCQCLHWNCLNRTYANLQHCVIALRSTATGHTFLPHLHVTRPLNELLECHKVRTIARSLIHCHHH